MKITGGRVEDFLRAPPRELRAVLVYGPDLGLVRERARALIEAVAGDEGDPFRVSELAAGELEWNPARLEDEAAQLSLTGGRRAVSVRGAGEAQAPPLKAFLERPVAAALVIVEAGELGPRSGLRRLFEPCRDAAALPCYRDEGRALEELIAATLGKAGLGIEAGARDYLAQHLGADRLVTRGELEKLALYMAADGGSESGIVTLDDAMACVGDSAALGLEDVAFAAAQGEGARLERALAKSFAEGSGPVPALRATARHLMRLHLASGLRDGGVSLDEAVDGLRPKVFYKRVAAFKAQLRLWSTVRLASALDMLTQAERDCKSTGTPAQAVCGHALMRLAAVAREQR